MAFLPALTGGATGGTDQYLPSRCRTRAAAACGFARRGLSGLRLAAGARWRAATWPAAPKGGRWALSVRSRR